MRFSTFTLVDERAIHYQLTGVVLLERGLSTWQQSSICQTIPTEVVPGQARVLEHKKAYF